MSSILDALEKVEAAERPGAAGAFRVVVPARRHRTTAALVLAFAAGVGLTLWLRSTPVTAPPAPVAVAPTPVAAPSAPPVVAPAPVAPSAEAPRTSPPAAEPEGAAAVPHREAPASPSPAAEPAAAPAPRAVEASAPAPTARETPAIAPTAPPPRVVEPPAVPPDAPPRPVAAAPQIRLSFLAYSPTPGRRSAALSVGDGPLVILHEGESTGDLEVARILPDRVELRRGGRTIEVRPRD